MIPTAPRSYLRVSLLIVLLSVGFSFPARGQEAAETPAAETPPAETPAAETPPAEPAPAETPPAEPAPAETPPAEAAPAETPPPEKPLEPTPQAAAVPALSYTKLADPAIAEQLGLTDEQRAAVAALLTERSTTAAAAAEAARPAVLAASEQKLAAVLTEAQRGEFAKLEPEPRLRFSFRFQRWADVLEWFAGEADLSLVLDAPPPGTFNYTDTREYTPTEAIDLLNGVLLTKGYTLIRRGRMLLVINLQDGIPEGLVPKISLEELEKRGKFEMVTVQFALGRRPAATVTAEITPLLGPHGKIVPMPATGQILVTDTAGIMRAINVVIESIAEPPVKPVRPRPPRPPQPWPLVLAVYPVKPADPAVAIEVLTALVPAAKLVMDEPADQIHVHATAAQQVLVKEVLEKMKASQPPEKKSTLETYPITAATSTDLVTTLETVVPEAQLSIDATAGKLVAWCPAADHETIQSALAKLQGEHTPDEQLRFEVYRLRTKATAALLTSLQPLVPRAKLTMEPTTGNLVVWGSSEEHRVLGAALGKLRLGGSTAGPYEAVQAEVYRLTRADPTTTLKLLQEMLPDAQLSVDPQTNSLVALATAADQRIIKTTLDQLQPKQPGPDTPELRFYTLTKAAPASLTTVLTNATPRAEVTLEADKKHLAVLATAADHEIIKSIVEKVETTAPVEEKNQLAIYPVTPAQRTRFESVLATVTAELPGIKVITDAEPGELAIWAKPLQHETIRGILEQLKRDVPPEDKYQLTAYPITSADPTAVMSMLETLFPNTQLQLDAKTNRLLVWTNPAQQESIKASLDEIQSQNVSAVQPRFIVYPVRGANAAGLITSLQPLAPKAKLTVDTKTGNLVVWATPGEHEVLKTALGELGRGDVLANTPQVEVYRLSKADPTTTLALLKSLFPDAQFNVDAQTSNLIAVAVPADQQAIRSLLEQLQPVEPSPDDPKLQFYPLEEAPPPSLLTALKQLAPKAQVTLEADGKRLMVVASAADHEMIRSTLGQIQQSLPPEEKNRLVIYPVTPAQRKRFQAILTTVTADVPGMKVVQDTEPGELAVWAKPKQHAIIAEIIEQLTHEVPAEQQYQFATYQIKSADPESISSVMESLFPDVKTVLDKKARRLSVWALAADQEVIKSAIEQMDSGEPVDTDEKVMVYPMPKADPETAVLVLQELLPEVKFFSDKTAGTIVARAVKSDHEKIKQIVEQMQIDTPPEEKPRVEVYPIDTVDASELVETLKPMVPEAQLTVDPTATRLVAWATPEEHETLKSAIEKLKGDRPLDTSRQVEVYRLSEADPQAALELLKTLVPRARLSADSAARSIIAVATVAEHRTIQSTLEQLEPKEPGPDTPVLRVYPLIEAVPDGLLDALSQLAPKAQVSLEAEGKRLMVVASPADHEAIKSAVERIETTLPPQQKNRLVVYPVTPAQQKRFAAVLETVTAELPGMKVIADAQVGELSVWAKPTQHVMVTGILEQLKRDVPAEQQYQLAAYPITSADPTSVLTVMKSLFPDLQFVLDPNTDRLVVWTHAEQHEAIEAAIKRLDAEKSGEAKEEVVVYSIRDADPQAAVGILQELLPAATLQSDPTAGTLIARARAKDQQVIKQVIEQMQLQGSPETRPRLDVYPLGGADAAGLVTMLQPMVPKAQLSVDPTQTRLIAWGTPKEHEMIKTAVEKLGGGSLEFTRQVEVYRLTRASPTTTLALLQTLVPTARLSADPQTRSIIAVATPADHQTIRGTLEQLQPEKPGADSPQLRFYRLTQPAPPTLVLGLQELAPRAQITPDISGKRLMVVATPADHETIQANVAQIEQAASLEEKSRLVVYPVTPAERTRFTAVMTTLTAEMPEVKVITDAQPGELSIWARPSQHVVIAGIIEQLKREVPEEEQYQLAAYPIKLADPESVLSVLQNLFPEAKIVLDEKTRRLLVWTRPADHKAIKAALDEMDTGVSADVKEKFMVYPVPDADPQVAITMLQELLPDVKFGADAKAGTIVAWGRKADHETIAEIINQMQQDEPSELKPRAEIYTLKSAKAADAQALLTAAAPNATISPGTDPRQLIVWARPAEHEKIQEALAKIDLEESPETAARAVVYTLEANTIPEAIYRVRLLQQAVPEANFTIAADPSQLVAWARPAEHEKIKSIIEQLAEKGPIEKRPAVVVYTLTHTTAAAAMRLLTPAVPNARLAAGDDPSQLIAWAKPADHEEIQRAIDELDQEEPPELAPTMEVYTVQTATAAQAMAALRTIVPNAELSAGADLHQFVAWARLAEHEKIKATLEKLDQEESPETARRTVTYTIEAASPTVATRVITAAVPEATLTSGVTARQLIAWARPAEHKVIAEIVAQMADAGPDAATRKMVIYTLQSTPPASVVPALRGIIPEAYCGVGVRPHQVIAWARPTDHARIEELLQQFDQDEPPETRSRVEIYTVQTATAASAITVLTSTVPGAKLSLGADPHQFVAWARPTEHEKIKATLEKLDQEESPETARQTVTYTIESTSPTQAVTVLRAAVPEAQFTPGAEPHQVIAYARPAHHKVIEEIVTQMAEKGPENLASKVVVYTFESTTAAKAITALTQVVPQATLSAGSDPNQLIAWARPADHEKIAQIVAKMDQPEPAEKSARMVVYTVEATAAADAVRFLNASFPEAEFTAGSDPRQVIAWARPAEHEKIKAAVAELSKEESPETAPKAVIYTLKSTSRARTIFSARLLQQAVPNATLTLGADPSKLIVWARPDEHEKIKAIVEQLRDRGPPGTAPKAVVYTLEATDAATMTSVLQTAVPDAQVSGGDDPSELIVWATPEDHQLIKTTIEQIEAEGLRGGERVLAAYPMRKEDVPSFLELLDSTLKKNVRLVTDPNRDALVVWASPKHHEAIKHAVDQFTQTLGEAIEPTSKVYRFRRANPRAALQVLTTLVPEASIALDAANRSLVVSALADDHEKIQATIEEMDREDAELAPKLEIHRLASADPANVLSVLRTLFADHPDLQISLDENNEALIAIASPEEQKTIRELIGKIEKGALADPNKTLELYSLKNIDESAALNLLEDLLQKQGAKVDLSIDSGGNQLIAIARPPQHTVILQTLEKLRTEERKLEIFQLDYIEPWTAQTAIDSLFSDEGYATTPDVDIDQDTQQLFIRATEKQLEEIRKLLAKMGETGLKSLKEGSGGRLRVIPFRGDTKAALEELQRVWPQLRKNPIRMVKPSAETPESPQQSPTPLPPPENDAQDQPPESPAATEPLAPVFVVVGDGSITVACEDPEALDQFESLLRSMSQRSGYAGRDFSIFVVRKTSAASVAETLTKLFRAKLARPGAAASWRRSSRLVIVPDERLNTILVQGSRADREKIEELLKVLDTDEVPEALAANKPKLIPIKNTRASRVERVIRDIFKTQLSSRTAGSATALPSWLSSQISVDEVTNSLIVMAPSPLFDEITKLAETLDQAAAEDPALGLKLIPLKKASAGRVQDALDTILKEGRVRFRKR